MTLKAVLTCSIEMVQKLCQFNGTVFSQVRKAKWQTNKLKHCFPHLSYCVLLAPYSCWETSWVKKHIRHNILYMNSITHIYVISFIFSTQLKSSPCGHGKVPQKHDHLFWNSVTLPYVFVPFNHYDTRTECPKWSVCTAMFCTTHKVVYCTYTMNWPIVSFNDITLLLVQLNSAQTCPAI